MQAVLRGEVDLGVVAGGDRAGADRRVAGLFQPGQVGGEQGVVAAEPDQGMDLPHRQVVLAGDLAGPLEAGGGLVDVGRARQHAQQLPRLAADHGQRYLVGHRRGAAGQRGGGGQPVAAGQVEGQVGVHHVERGQLLRGGVRAEQRAGRRDLRGRLLDPAGDVGRPGQPRVHGRAAAPVDPAADLPERPGQRQRPADQPGVSQVHRGSNTDLIANGGNGSPRKGL